MARILVIDDNETVRDGVATVLHRMGHRAMAAPGGAQGLKAFESDPDAIDVVITDLRMEDVDGMDVLRGVLAARADAVVMLITAHGSVRTAVEAMQAGALDFIEKPFPADLLREKVTRAVEAAEQRRSSARLRNENAYLRETLRGDDAGPLERLFGSSPQMARVHQLVRKVAGADSTVHIHGESGTGKELVASAIHELSPRAAGPFVKVNCGAISDSLLESELFGHEKGAFTDAVKRRLGRFELADGGTLFLDEIGEITPAMQVRLLRVLQERTFERVGGEKPVEVDVRIVTATNRDLRREVAEGRFREDLYYRLAIIPIELPPLRERPGDVAELAAHFLGRLAGRTRSAARRIAPDALEALQSYAWPGNVRELENVMEQALVFAEGETIGVEDLPPGVTGRRALDALPLPDGTRPLPDILEDLERRLIARAYDQAGGVKTETARLLGIKTPALYYKLEKYGIGEIQKASDS
jgi:two-component system response regulator HydG